LGDGGRGNRAGGKADATNLQEITTLHSLPSFNVPMLRRGRAILNVAWFADGGC
jgi:hypothetical protein